MHGGGEFRGGNDMGYFIFKSKNIYCCQLGMGLVYANSEPAVQYSIVQYIAFLFISRDKKLELII